jgi:hypothetical protein
MNYSLKLPEDMRQCIETCWECRHECQTTLFNHCLVMGGKHVEPEHVKLMADCIQICQLAADAMVRQSPMHADICATCAKICDACAESCEGIDSVEMKNCAKICRKCADDCREMGGMKGLDRAAQSGSESHIMA